MNKPDFNEVRVVMVTYQRYEELIQTLEALELEGFSSHQFIIIDNNPAKKRNIEVHQKYASSTWILPDQNIASAGGFSLGMKAANKQGATWAWLFNDDSRPKKGAFDSLLNALNTLPQQKVGLMKIGNLNQEGKATLLNWKGVRKPEYVDPSNDPIKTDLVTFDGCLISCGLMDEIGYCDPQYFMGTYEFDYCLKAKDAGFGIFTIPNGLIEDGKLGSVGGSPPWRQYYNTRNHLWLGIHRRDFRTIWAWMVRELKYTYAILRFQDHKWMRIRLKLLAFLHAVLGKRGMILDPEDFRNL